MINTGPQENLYWNMMRVSVRGKHSLMRIAEMYDLTIMQLFALCSMEMGHPTPMNTLSTLLYCDASNITGIIDRLLASDLISRQENPNDRRIKMIGLTEKGDQLRQKILGDLEKHESHVLDNLSKDQQQQLQQLLLATLQEPNTSK